MTPPPGVRMRWQDLLFLHWRVDPELMRSRVPAELEVDCFEGSAWIGLVPFTMANTRFRGVPDLGPLRHFHECNVRTYVRHTGRTGVWFFSLDAASFLPVVGARLLWRLPYVWSRIESVRRDDTIDYRLSRRLGGGAAHITWERGELLPPSAPASLEHFLTERYWLFARRFGRVQRSRVEHVPWPLRKARVARCEESLIRAAGIDVQGEPHAMCSDGVDVLGWNLVASDAPPEADGSPALSTHSSRSRTTTRSSV